MHTRIDDRLCAPLSGKNFVLAGHSATHCPLTVLYIDVRSLPRTPIAPLPAALLLAFSACLSITAQDAPPAAGPPKTTAILPLSEVHRGMTGTAWTVFQGSVPEPMRVEILGVLRGARGPGQDMILAQLHGAKPEYTGVVEGMSGSPVYVDGKLIGSLSYRIGQFSKDPIAGITPIEQILEVRDLAAHDSELREAANVRPGESLESPEAYTPSFLASSLASAAENTGTSKASGLFDANTVFQPIETPLVMSGFSPDAIRFWQERTAGTSLTTVAVGGTGAASAPDVSHVSPHQGLVPGSAVSMQLVRGDLEISATCTVTYVDPKQLLACGHPVLEAGLVSLPMTTADVLATLASPLQAFKIINTGATVGEFTEDRESGIRGVFGTKAQMIPMHITIDTAEGSQKVNVDILDLPSLTPLAMQVVLYQSLLQTNESSSALSYHVTGKIDLADFPSVPLDQWAAADSGLAPAPMMAALEAGQQFQQLYSNGARQGAVRQIDLHVEGVSRHVQVALEQARVVSGNIIHAGDTVEVEATLRPWQQPERNVRIPVKLPARLTAGNLRVLVSDGATLDRTLQQARFGPGIPQADLKTVLAQARNQHAADRVYVSLLAPETQGEIDGETLTSLPLSMANALEPLRNAQEAGLNGESAEVAGQAPAGGVLTGFQILNVHIEPGGGLD